MDDIKKDDVDVVVTKTEIINDTNNLETEIKVNYMIYSKFNQYLDRKYDFNSELKEKNRQKELETVFLVGINHCIQDLESTTTSSKSLLFMGKKTRKDVLIKLAKIANFLSNCPNFPYVKERELINSIKEILGHRDQRTLKNYFKTIKDYSTKDYRTGTYNVERFYNLAHPYLFGNLGNDLDEF